MKGIEFVLLAVGALAGTFLRYNIVSTPVWLGAIPLNVLAINVLGSFTLGVFSIFSLVGILIRNIHYLLLLDFAVRLPQCHHLHLNLVIF